MRVWYLVRETLNNIRVHRGDVVIGTVTTAFALACFGVFLLLYLNLQHLAENLQSGIEVIAYLDPDASEQVVSDVHQRLRRDPAAVDVSVISKEQALRDFRRHFQRDALFLEEGNNPLPVSFVMNVRSPESVSEFVERVKRFAGVQHVQHSQEWLDKLSIVVSHFRLGAMVIGTILAVATATIIRNTVHLSLYTRREEIEILRLIGATGRFIAIPHVVEGAMLGAVGGGLSLVLLKVSFESVRSELLQAVQWFDGLEHSLTFFPVPVSLLLVLAGMVLGCGSSLLSVRRLINARS
ncbi:MAG: ABC transporter permease [Nitrospira sp.]|nr:ABC transporter permease [Nitrospira sp.]MDD9859242.1 ABC transporter permease [Nitrospira sp.]